LRSDTEDDFVHLVSENFEQTIRAIQGRQMTFYRLVAFSGIWLEEGSSMRTPWGELVACDRMVGAPSLQRRTASAVLAVPCRRRPRIEPGLQTSTMYGDKQNERPAQAALLVPVACVLAFEDPARRPEPAIAWQADLFPMSWVRSYGGGSYKPRTKWIHLTPDEVNAVTD
jgi:hypothetical protein